jgi:cysteine desulfurase family protein (TIGR01976 family)
MQLDIDFVRDQFPAFAEPVLRGQAFFENAGGSYTCKQVIDRLFRFYHERKVQPYGYFEASKLAGNEMDEARRGLAAVMGVDTDEVSFGPSTTQNVYVLAHAVAEWLTRGDTLIVTNQDHEANSGAWRRLADRGITVREWSLDPQTGQLNLSDLQNMLDDTVKLVCFPHCSNVIGDINPVAEIAQIAHDAGAFVVVDGVSYAPHGLPDVDALGADVYMFSAYKTYGPHQGIMVIRREFGMTLPNQGHYFNGDALYKRFTPAGPDHAQVAASAGMVDYLTALYAHHFGPDPKPLRAQAHAVHDMCRDYEALLLQPLLTQLANTNKARLLGPANAEHRAPTVALDVGGRAKEVSQSLASHGIMAGASDFYAVRPLAAMGVPEGQDVLRLSFVHYTRKSEIDHVLNVLNDIL